MHIPDGLLDVRTSVGTGVVAGAGVAASLRLARTDLAERMVPLAGLVAAYVFAAQMLNVPIAAGTSGHLLGAALAAALVGPWVGALCLTVVLCVQSLVFADGGLSALGANVVNMALVATIGGWLVLAFVRAVLGGGRRGVLVGTAVSSWCSTVLAAAAFTGEYALGGGAVSSRTVAWSMIGAHAVVGIGEAVVTTMIVSSVLATRPDLVYVARGQGASATGRIRRRVPLVAAVAVLVGLAVVASLVSSDDPDTLSRVAERAGVGPASGPGPLAGYEVAGVGRHSASAGLAATLGVLVTVVLALSVFALVRRAQGRAASRP